MDYTFKVSLPTLYTHTVFQKLSAGWTPPAWNCCHLSVKVQKCSQLNAQTGERSELCVLFVRTAYILLGQDFKTFGVVRHQIQFLMLVHVCPVNCSDFFLSQCRSCMFVFTFRIIYLHSAAEGERFTVLTGVTMTGFLLVRYPVMVHKQNTQQGNNAFSLYWIITFIGQVWLHM